MNLLKNGELFPDVSGETINHGNLTVPEDLTQEWAVLLYYRGEW